MKKSWILLSFSNFFIAALFGLILRGAFVWEMEWIEYRNLMHGHSHVAMLGWVYMALYGMFWSRFLPETKRKRKFYSLLFWFTQITVIGMMVSFPLQGYAALSISFSSLHILASYAFCFRIWKDHNIRNPAVKRLVYAALIFLILSTFGVWILGPLAVSGGRNTALYQVAIQFYLHFQFHGWFTFAVLALLLESLHHHQWEMMVHSFNRFFFMFICSTILTFGLVLFWAYGNEPFAWANNLGLVLQLLSLGILLQFSWNGIQLQLKQGSFTENLAFRFGFISLMLKIVIQSMVIFPEAAVSATTIRPLMMGFIHLTLLGWVSAFLIFFFSIYGWIRKSSSLFLAGLTIFITGFTLTEIMLFSQGTFYWMHWGQLPYYHELLFVFSAFLPISILLFILNKNYIKKNVSLTGQLT